MIKFSLKQAIALSVLAGVSAGAYADKQQDLGTISTSTPTTFSSIGHRLPRVLATSSPLMLPSPTTEPLPAWLIFH